MPTHVRTCDNNLLLNSPLNRLTVIASRFLYTDSFAKKLHDVSSLNSPVAENSIRGEIEIFSANDNCRGNSRPVITAVQ